MQNNVKVNGKILSAYSSNEKPLMIVKGETWVKKIYSGGQFEMEFLRNKNKIIKNKNKFKACLSS